MCDNNLNEIINIDFNSINDEFNWVSNGVNAIETFSGKLVLRPDGPTDNFSRSLGELDPTNNFIRLRADINIIKPQASTDDTICVVFGVYIGTELVDEYSVYLENLSPGSSTAYNLDRKYKFEGLSGTASIRINVIEGLSNHLELGYLIAEDFNFCDDNYRTYFAIDGFLESSKNSISSGLKLREWKVDDEETLTTDFFAENNNSGGNPIDDWKFAKARIDGSERVSENNNPNTFNPLVSEWGLLFDEVNSFHGGKPTQALSGSNYGEGVLSIGFDKPAILNADLQRKEGCFFIDIDYTKNLKIVFDVLANNKNTDPFKDPSIYRRYTILFNVKNCECLYFYEDILSGETINVKEDGFLSGLTGIEDKGSVINCDESFSFEGERGIFEFEIDFGLETGMAGINYNAANVPDKFTIIWNNQEFTTGFVGRSTFNQQLLNEGIPMSEINTEDPSNGAGQLLFNKNEALPNKATIIVEAPLDETGWDISGICPQQPNIESSMVEVGEAECESTPVRWDDVYLNEMDVLQASPENGDVIFIDSSLTAPYDGQGKTYKMRISNPPFQIVSEFTFDISSNGVVSNRNECGSNDNGGISISEINEDSSQNSNCFSCWTVTVEVSGGDTRIVEFIFNLSGSGSPTSCPGNGVGIFQNTTETISLSKTYRFGIDAASESTPSLQETSLITLIVRDQQSNSIIDQKTFSRVHGNVNC